MPGFKQIKIFTDTNIVHATKAYQLVSSEVYNYISKHQQIESVELKWYLADMVVEERRHQMVAAALALRPKLEDLERLLDHKLCMTGDVMRDRVDSKIRRTISNLGLNTVALSHDDVDWADIIRRSAERRPPFEAPSEKEKGFRDAVIATTFLQEVERSPKTPRSCLLVFVSGDGRVREYLEEKVGSEPNVRLLTKLDDLKSFLNAIASEVTEEFLGELLPRANQYFYDFEKRSGLYLRAEIGKRLQEQYSDQLEAVAAEYPGAFRRDGGVALDELTFIKKSGQTVTWSKGVSFEFQVVRYDFGGAKGGTLLSMEIDDPTILARGVSKFRVVWEHQISSSTGNLIRGKVLDIQFIENAFSGGEEAD